MQCGCPFSLQHWPKTQHLASYFRQEEEHWQSLVEFSFPAAYWKCVKCCFSERRCILQGLVCARGSKRFARSALPQNDSPVLFSRLQTRCLLSLPSCFSSFLCLSVTGTQTQKTEKLFSARNLGRRLSRCSSAPVFQLEAAVTALSHKVRLFPTTTLKKKTFNPVELVMLSHLSWKWPRSIFYNCTMAKWLCIG